MINNDRIIPVQKIDLLSLIGTFLNIASISFEVLKSADVDGIFTVSANGTYLVDQPVMTLDFGSATAATVYFVPAYSYESIKLAGADVTAEVKPDGASLYKAVLADGAVTVTAVTPEIAAE